MAAGLLDDERPRNSVARKPCVSADCVGITLAVGFLPGFVLFICCALYFSFEDPEFWVKVSGVEGLDRSAGAVTAPTFNITLRVNNRGNNFAQFCGKGGSVDVAYTNVPLAHGEFPEFCMPPGLVGSVPMVATSEGLGLPDDLYERMESQRRRQERVTLAVHVQVREVTGSRGSSSVMLWCRVVLHGQPEGPFVCPMIREPDDYYLPIVISV